MKRRSRVWDVILGKQCLRLYKLDEQGDFRFKLFELRVLPLIADFVLPLCEISGNVANRNIVVILSGSANGYIEMMASL